MTHDEVTVLRAALKRLSFAAQTSGGTAGRDDELLAAVDEAKQALAMSATKPAVEGDDAELVERLREQARQESAAHKMMADAKTARQTDREDAWTDVGYGWVKPEQTTSWKAADRLEALARPVAVEGDALERAAAALLSASRDIPGIKNLGTFACIVSPEQARTAARAVIEALARRMGELEGALAKAFGAIASLPEDALGFGQDDHSRWPLRDELLSEIDAVLQGHSSSSGEGK